MKKNSATPAKQPFNMMFIPVIVAITVIPLLVRTINVKLRYDELPYYSYSDYLDFFSRAKSYVLIAVAVIMLAVIIFFFKRLSPMLSFFKHNIYIKIYLISASVFLVFTLLSSIFSDYKDISFFGWHDRAEGFISIMCYIVLFLYTAFTYKTSKDFTYIIACLTVVVAITSFIGVFQYFGNDLIASDIGKYLVFGANAPKTEDINLLYETGKLYGTFFHYNYVGSFVAITVPIFGVMAVFEQSLKRRIIWIVSVILSLWLLLGSTSRAGIIGIAIAVLFAVVIMFNRIIRYWKPFAISILAVIVVAVGLNFATNNKIFERIPSLISDILSVFSDTSDFNYLDHIPVRDIKNTEKGVSITSQLDTINVATDKDKITFTDSKGENVSSSFSDDMYIITDPRFPGYSFAHLALNDKSTYRDALVLYLNSAPNFLFRIDSDNSIYLCNISSNRRIDLEFPKTIGFKGKERLGSARGYIWSRALPMLSDNLILGTGPDTFMINFPQNDLLGKYWAYETTTIFVDKPHNLFLQIFINYGGVALLAFLILLITYFVESIRLYAFKKEYNKDQVIGISVSLGIIGYFFAGIFNDSILAVAPVFWIMLGVGIAVNCKNRQDLLSVEDRTK